MSAASDHLLDQAMIQHIQQTYLTEYPATSATTNLTAVEVLGVLAYKDAEDDFIKDLKDKNQ